MRNYRFTLGACESAFEPGMDARRLLEELRDVLGQEPDRGEILALKNRLEALAGAVDGRPPRSVTPGPGSVNAKSLIRAVLRLGSAVWIDVELDGERRVAGVRVAGEPITEEQWQALAKVGFASASAFITSRSIFVSTAARASMLAALAERPPASQQGSSLQLGSRGDRVRELQVLFLMTGVADPGPPDAVFGALTLAGVRHARAALRLPGDQADEDLLGRLRALPRRRRAIPKVRTPAKAEDAWQVLAKGYERVFGRVANPLAVRVALAQLQEEHGVELANIFVFNLGNQDAVEPWEGPFFCLTALEEVAQGRQNRTKALRAYASLQEGAEGYWRRLVESYAGALPAFERGDPGAAAEELKALRYFTGSLPDYKRAMVDRYRALERLGLGRLELEQLDAADGKDP
jgi:hypothetical protein